MAIPRFLKRFYHWFRGGSRPPNAPEPLVFFWGNLKRSLQNFWFNLKQPFQILKNDLLQTAKQFFQLFQLFVVQIIRKGIFRLIESLKILYNNQYLLDHLAFYFILFCFFLLMVLLISILLNRRR